MGRAASVLARVVALAAVGLVVMAGPAAADPPRPGDYTSEVTAIEPRTRGFEIRVLGGDAFLELEADRGVEVVVLGYEGEPYLRFLPEGGVEENRRSTAAYLNADRYARVDVPEALSGPNVADLEPDWRRVAGGHRYAWHDHRVHWMAPDAPPAVERGGSFDWNGPVALLVDGTRVEVSGVITYEHDVSPLPWLGGAAVVAALLAVDVRRRTGRWPAGMAALVAVAALGASWLELAEAPDGVGGSIAPLVLAGAAAALALFASLVPARLRSASLLASAVALGSWCVVRFGVLTHPVLPTPLPGWADRGITAAAIGLVVVLVPATFRDLSAGGR